MNTLPEIPPEVTGAANLVADWMKRNGHTRWELLEICSRNHAADLEQVQAKCAKISRVIDAMDKLDDSMTDAQLAAESTLREAISITVEADTAEQLAAAQHRNGLLLLQQAHEENIRAELKSELVALHKRLEYLSIEVSFANQKRDQWKMAAYFCGDALRNCMGHISREHPHWQAAFKAHEMVLKLLEHTFKKNE